MLSKRAAFVIGQIEGHSGDVGSRRSRYHIARHMRPRAPFLGRFRNQDRLRHSTRAADAELRAHVERRADRSVADRPVRPQGRGAQPRPRALGLGPVLGESNPRNINIFPYRTIIVDLVGELMRAQIR